MRYIIPLAILALLWHVSDNLKAYFVAWPEVVRERTEQERWVAMQECLKAREKWCRVMENNAP